MVGENIGAAATRIGLDDLLADDIAGASDYFDFNAPQLRRCLLKATKLKERAS